MNDTYITLLKEMLLKSLKILFGFFLVALGTVLLLHSDLGLNPWGVLHHGISIRTPLTFGQASQIVGFSAVLLCSCFKIIPGIGTIFNMIFFGLFIDILNQSGLFFIPQNIKHKLLMLALGILATAIGTYLYMRENLGAGPRDGLMLLLCKKLKFKAGTIRSGIEMTVISLGYALGGKVGIGSLIIALTLGPTLNRIFSVFNYDVKKNHQENVVETFSRFKNIKAINSNE